MVNVENVMLFLVVLAALFSIGYVYNLQGGLTTFITTGPAETPNLDPDVLCKSCKLNGYACAIEQHSSSYSIECIRPY